MCNIELKTDINVILQLKRHVLIIFTSYFGGDAPPFLNGEQQGSSEDVWPRCRVIFSDFSVFSLRIKAVFHIHFYCIFPIRAQC